MEIFKNIIVPIITAVLGFFGGMKYSSIRNSKVQNENEINGNGNIVANGDVNAKK